MNVGSIILENASEIFIIYGETGQYDDHNVWIVGAFRTRKNAEDYLVELSTDATLHRIPLDVSLAFYGACPSTLLDKGIALNWVSFGVEYSIGTVKVLDA